MNNKIFMYFGIVFLILSAASFFYAIYLWFKFNVKTLSNDVSGKKSRILIDKMLKNNEKNKRKYNDFYKRQAKKVTDKIDMIKSIENINSDFIKGKDEMAKEFYGSRYLEKQTDIIDVHTDELGLMKHNKNVIINSENKQQKFEISDKNYIFDRTEILDSDVHTTFLDDSSSFTSILKEVEDDENIKVANVEYLDTVLYIHSEEEV